MEAEGVLRLDRGVRALVCALFFWLPAAMIHFGATASEGTRKTKAVHFMLETLVVGTFGRPGGVLFFVVLGALTGAALLWRSPTARSSPV
jgi:hypothetical protein